MNGGLFHYAISPPITFDFKHNKKYRYKKLFTKLDLYWKYNNVQIEESDK